MSLAIDPDRVVGVLLANDPEWYTIVEGSFDLDAYEYVDEGSYVYVAGGAVAGICSTGFRFQWAGGGDDSWVAGPLTAIVAVRYHRPPT